MRILILSSRAPWPTDRADQLTVERMMRFLAACGDELDLVCFVDDARQDRALREHLGPLCRHIDTVRRPRWAAYAHTAIALTSRMPMQVSYFRSAALARRVRARVAAGDYDLVYAHAIRMAEYARDLPVPKVLGAQLSQALNLKRMVENARDPLRRAFFGIEERRVRPYEAEVCADFDRVVLVGRRDVEELARTAPVPNAVVCPHGQDIPPLESVRAARRQPGAIVFGGVMATYTNVDAASWFARDIFPRVQRAVPEASFWIVGRRPQRAVQALARPPHVVVTGEVPDFSEVLCRASVAVDPLRMGAGMQNKLVQFMGCELPVVTTRIANEGIGGTDDKELLVRDDPDGFADAVIGLLRDPSERARLGRAAWRFAEAHWTWDALFEKLRGIFLEAAAQADAPPRRA
ncbi:MAG: glycosyltransferase [Deltaproteobacteria bacterium]|nr:MAG: glycosyltransferase [Deltaproteobacteria bacterium]